jgi:hypothetical protein
MTSRLFNTIVMTYTPPPHVLYNVKTCGNFVFPYPPIFSAQAKPLFGSSGQKKFSGEFAGVFITRATTQWHSITQWFSHLVFIAGALLRHHTFARNWSSFKRFFLSSGVPAFFCQSGGSFGAVFGRGPGFRNKWKRAGVGTGLQF